MLLFASGWMPSGIWNSSAPAGSVARNNGPTSARQGAERPYHQTSYHRGHRRAR